MGTVLVKRQTLENQKDAHEYNQRCHNQDSGHRAADAGMTVFAVVIHERLLLVSKIQIRSNLTSLLPLLLPQQPS